MSDSKPFYIYKSMCVILESFITFPELNEKSTMDNNDSYMLA